MANGVWTTRLDITFMLKQQKKRQKIRGNANICEVHGQPLCCVEKITRNKTKKNKEIIKKVLIKYIL